MPRKQYSEETLQSIIDDYNNGVSGQEISKKYHVDFVKLKKRLIAENKIVSKEIILNIDQLKEISNRYKNGEYLKDLANEFGVGICKLRNDLKRNYLYHKKYENISDEELQTYIREYQNGMCPKDISIKYGRGDSSIINALRKANVYNESKNRWTDDEINILKKFYPIEPTESIMKRLPRHNKQMILSKASSLNIKGYKPDEWTTGELDLLKENYGVITTSDLFTLFNGRHSLLAIRTKAQRLGFQSDPYWTEDEENILKENYSFQPFDVLQNLFPDKSEWAIRHHARKLNLKSKQYLDEKYSKEQLKYIKDNWLTLNDTQMAKVLNKSPAGIMAQRNKMGLYKIKRDYSNYKSLDKFFRAHTQHWKAESMKKCDYKCILTGSKDFAIHHIYGFNNILKEVYEILDNQNLLKSTRVEDYSKSELDYMLEIFSEVHNKYPLGICLRKDIHNLFHKIYGCGGNTIEQWNKFYEDFKNNLYKKEIA